MNWWRNWLGGGSGRGEVERAPELRRDAQHHKLRAMLERLVRAFEAGDLDLVLELAAEICLRSSSLTAETAYIFVTAHCLRGESLRGNERFEDAADEYQQAIAIGQDVPVRERVNEYYVAWYPRAWLGFVVVLRRLVTANPQTLVERLEHLRGDVNIQRTQDFESQIDAVKGAVQRQMGLGSDARSHLERSRELLSSRRFPWYLFWEPLQVEAHLMLAEFVDPAVPFAEAIARAERHLGTQGILQWSQDAALVVLLQAELGDRLFDDDGPETARVALDEEVAGVTMRELLDQLRMESPTKDPTWHAEGLSLNAAWLAACGHHTDAVAAMENLAARPMRPLLGLLKGLELSILSDSLLGTEAPSPGVQRLRREAAGTLDQKRSMLTEFGVSERDLDWAEDLLCGKGESVSAADWSEDSMQRFRAVLWP